MTLRGGGCHRDVKCTSFSLEILPQCRTIPEVPQAVYTRDKYFTV